MNSAVSKKLRSPKLWIIFVAIALGVWGLAFYWIAQPTRSEKLEIWLGAEFGFKCEVVADVEAVARSHGIKECSVNSYDPRDTYYAQAFSLRANSVDIYILEKAMSETLFETGIFAPLDYARDGAEFLHLDETETVYGVKLVGDYYIFVNSASKKDRALLYGVITVLADAGASL